MRYTRCYNLKIYGTQVEKYGPVPAGKHRNVEAVFQPENFRIFSDDFRPVPAGKHRELIGIHRELIGIHWKKSNKFPVGILLPLPAISGAFLWDPVTFPHLSCRIMWDPVAGMFDLGSCSFDLAAQTFSEMYHYLFGSCANCLKL